MTRADRREVSELRQAITALTGKVPASSNLDYLRKRIVMVRPQATVDESLELARRAATSHAAEVLGIERYALVIKLGGPSVNDIVRRAVDEYLVKHGLGAGVERAKRTVRS